MRIENMCKMRALQAAYPGGRLMDMLLNDPDASKDLKLKRVQFDVHESLKDRLESVCGLLNFSQREFMEAVLLDALELAERTFFDVYHEATGVDFGDDHAVPKNIVLRIDEVQPC